MHQSLAREGVVNRETKQEPATGEKHPEKEWIWSDEMQASSRSDKQS